MSKINTNKINDFDALRSVRQSDLKPAGKSESQALSGKTTFGTDKLEFSDRVAETGKFLDQLKDLPDVRAEKVESLRQQISAGTYQPTSETIADAILKDES